MKYKVGDLVRIVAVDYSNNEYWLGFVGHLGVVASARDDGRYYRVEFSASDVTPGFYASELARPTDVEILAYKLRGE